MSATVYLFVYVGLGEWGREWEMPPCAAIRCSFLTRPQYRSLPVTYSHLHHTRHGMETATETTMRTMTETQPRFRSAPSEDDEGEMTMSG